MNTCPTLTREFTCGPSRIFVIAVFLFERWPGITIEWDPGPRCWPLPPEEQRAFRRGVAEAVADILDEMNWMPNPPPN